MKKRAFITLIHGTFAPNAEWAAENSDFSKRIIDGLEMDLEFERIEWSGRNSVSDRISTAERLSETLARQRQGFPDSMQVIIGHSHGGSIIAHALSRNPKLAENIGCVFLATPFIDARARPDWIFIACVMAMASLIVLVTIATAVFLLASPEGQLKDVLTYALPWLSIYLLAVALTGLKGQLNALAAIKAQRDGHLIR